MYAQIVDSLGGNPGDKPPLLRVVRTTRMERFSWLVMGLIVLVTGLVFLQDKTGHKSALELVLLWVLVLSGIKLTVLGIIGRYPLPRWLDFLYESR